MRLVCPDAEPQYRRLAFARGEPQNVCAQTSARLGFGSSALARAEAPDEAVDRGRKVAV